MRRGLAHLYCQNAVQKQYTLTRPMLKKAVTRRRNTQVALQFLVDVDQGRRRPHAGLYGKAKPVGLADGMIGVLAQYHHPDLLQRCQVESAEIFAALGENSLSLRLLSSQKIPQRLHIRAFKLRSERSPPARSEEHTSELQSLMRNSYAVFCLKKKIKH